MEQLGVRNKAVAGHSQESTHTRSEQCGKSGRFSPLPARAPPLPKSQGRWRRSSAMAPPVAGRRANAAWILDIREQKQNKTTHRNLSTTCRGRSFSNILLLNLGTDLLILALFLLFKSDKTNTGKPQRTANGCHRCCTRVQFELVDKLLN